MRSGYARGALSNNVRIKYDECLSSWLVRSATTMEEKIKVQEYINSVEDPDFGFDSIISTRQLSDIEGSLDFDQGFLRRHFEAKTSWILPWDERSVFCLECLEDDISAGGAPYWRKNWCYLHLPVCIKHRRLLVQSGPAWQDPEKAWSVYFEKLRERSFKVEQDVDRSIGTGVYRRAELLAFRAQAFLASAHNNTHIRLLGHGGMVSGKEVLMVARILLESFLFPRLRHYGLAFGLARGMQSGFPCIRGKISLEDARALGCSDSHVFSRATALILVGCVFQIIPQVRFNDVRDALYLSAYVASGSPYDIARSGMILGRGRDYHSIIKRLNSLSEGLRYHLRDFLAGLKMLSL